MADVLAAAKARMEGGEGKGGEKTQIAKAPQKDGFGTAAAATGNRPTLRTSQVKGPVRPVQELIPPGLGKLGDQAAVAKRFASDLPLLHQQVKPSDLPPSDRALRAWAFFTAYAEAAAAHESTPEGNEIFDKALEKEGFGEYRDARTGKDGVKVAKWVLESLTPEEALDRAEQVEIEPPPEVLLSKAQEAKSKEAAKAQDPSAKPESNKAQDPSAKPEAAKTQEPPSKPEAAKTQETPTRPQNTQVQDTPRRPEDAPMMNSSSKSLDMKDSAFTQGPDRPSPERADAKAELTRPNPQQLNNPQPLILPRNPELERRRDDDASMIGRFEDAMKKMDRGIRLGSNMLWNALHQLRDGPGDSALEREKWNQIAFAAILAFVGLMLMVILVVSL
jgi:hypothetical protein